MPQEDRFKRQVDMLALALAKLLDRFIRLKGTGLLQHDLQNFNADLKKEIGIDLGETLNTSNDKLDELFHSRKLNDLHLDMLSEILFQWSESLDPDPNHEKVIKLYSKLIFIYEQLAQRDPIYSLERHLRLEKMRKFLEAGVNRQ